jgi:hypothetical protein
MNDDDLVLVQESEDLAALNLPHGADLPKQQSERA